MWKPEEVVPQHRRRAVVIFSSLVTAIFVYAAYLVYQTVAAYDNPSTSFVLSNGVYKYPDIYICLYDFFGCDTMELEGDCMGSAQSTEGGRSTAVFNLNRDDEQELDVDAFLTEERGWCVTFAASDIVIAKGERDPEDYILLNMYWYPGGSAGGSTTCIEEEGGWESHSESVFMHMRDVDTGIYSAGVQVSYSCMTSASDRHISNYVGIGLTKENKLGIDDTAVYKAVATSSAVYKDKRDSSITGISSPYAWLSMEVAQVTDSLEEITEIDPLNIAEILGNIGGFWDLLLLLWPVFFIAATREDPHLKGRNFRKSVTRGSEVVVGLSKPILRPAPLRRRGGLSVSSSGMSTTRRTATDAEAERPQWDTADSSAREQGNPPQEDASRHPRGPKTAPSNRNSPPPSGSREGVTTRLGLSPQRSRRKLKRTSSRESPQRGGVAHEQRVTRAPPGGQRPLTPGTPLCVAPPASPSSSRQASAGSLVGGRHVSASSPV